MKPTLFQKTKRSDFPGEAPRFDCLELVRKHIGECYFVSIGEALSRDTCTICYSHYLKEDWGLEGFPVEVLYDHVAGEGAYAKAFADDEIKHMKQAYEEGKAMGASLAAAVRGGYTLEGVKMLTPYEGPFPEDFRAGMEDVLRKKVDFS